MSDLKKFVALQAQLFAFLTEQDETTLEAIAAGTAQLAVVGAEVSVTPSKDPLQVAQNLSRLSSEDTRRRHLTECDLSAKDLKKVAKSLGIRGYSAFTKPKLVDLLAGHGQSQATAEPEAPTPPPRAPVRNEPAVERRVAPREPEPSTGPVNPDVDVAAIATSLRETETEEEGAAYLHAQHLDRESLLAVAAELQLTRVSRLSQTELEKRVLKQAIGARRKFAGLRKW
ncbi:hypothetical protein [Amycolatopsis sp. WQ 127309]|uniref:hypothetical protein n=1 Tax=Amycolatopsis sp. WQ 127309 TaxID=2932773 RepID=UPI001FF464AF|nr:hypothetical protein [Amycolatopsis sp. WQ 127309]UOZ07899.1 hypothetical protein MUY22_06335 [Amycolatopsis sp. WQ 127309]